MSPKGPTQDWTRDESRYADGELDADSAARLEARLRKEPDRARRIEAWQEAMDLWRDDVGRQVAASDPAAVTDRVIRSLGEAPDIAPDPGSVKARRYAVAALILLGLGLVGSAALGAKPIPLESPLCAPNVLREVEEDRFALEGDIQVQRFWAGVPRGSAIQDR